jgi:hypothetical protein
MIELGHLEKEPDLRKIWGKEDEDFTPWLAKYGLELLGDTIGIELELNSQEQEVGPFAADILCRDTATNNWVLIENQIEKTDHTHLGQILTYGASLEATTIVWIAKYFTEEHRAALDWLNEITDERFNFFGLEIELWRIDGSPIAPKSILCANLTIGLWVEEGLSISPGTRNNSLDLTIGRNLLNFYAKVIVALKLASPNQHIICRFLLAAWVLFSQLLHI